VTQTVDGGTGYDLLSVNYSNSSVGITSTFNATNQQGSIKAGKNQVSYKNIEQLNITGTAYDDYIVGSNGNDYLSGGSGGNDTILGGAGNDNLTIEDSTGDNLLDGGNGKDYLYASGASGDNTLKGGAGDDSLYGGVASDILIGGSGNDVIYGNGGNDIFVFNSFTDGVDSLYDFDVTHELIEISAAGFGGGLLAGSLSASQFTLGASATTSNQRFIYDLSTGALYFDQDGSAGGFSQVQFAQLHNGVSLTENNFEVV
jgi:Ca2+-binding RTX toxin-like protein